LTLFKNFFQIFELVVSIFDCFESQEYIEELILCHADSGNLGSPFHACVVENIFEYLVSSGAFVDTCFGRHHSPLKHGCSFSSNT
jgi:hypothetical protein